MDVRGVVADAAKIAINARRQCKSLLTASQQQDVEYAPMTMWLSRYFADNIKAPKRIREHLSIWLFGRMMNPQSRAWICGVRANPQEEC